jgi:hypothetical protein
MESTYGHPAEITHHATAYRGMLTIGQMYTYWPKFNRGDNLSPLI